MGAVKRFIDRNYKHFNAAALVDAAQAWQAHAASGGKMYLTMAGAMSTAELGISVAELIRRDLIHGLCVTGANLEEDLFNLVGNSGYERVPDYRALTGEQELALLRRGMNRVTDTCIPETVIKKVEGVMVEAWQAAEKRSESKFPHEYFYQVLREGRLDQSFEIDPKDSWLLAAAKANLPIWTPGWEDCTLGNIFVSRVMHGDLKGYSAIKHGLEQMESLVHWYRETASVSPIGFFQIGGGIAGDFSICVVPLLRQEFDEEIPLWSYFCQISDSTTSYGSYSGAVPNEKITWEKLMPDTPRFVIESDATIVFPLIAQYLLDG